MFVSKTKQNAWCYSLRYQAKGVLYKINSVISLKQYCKVKILTNIKERFIFFKHLKINSFPLSIRF